MNPNPSPLAHVRTERGAGDIDPLPDYPCTSVASAYFCPAMHQDVSELRCRA